MNPSSGTQVGAQKPRLAYPKMGPFFDPNFGYPKWGPSYRNIRAPILGTQKWGQKRDPFLGTGKVGRATLLLPKNGFKKGDQFQAPKMNPFSSFVVKFVCPWAGAPAHAPAFQVVRDMLPRSRRVPYNQLISEPLGRQVRVRLI